MIIREANREDLNSIIEVLRASLGEASSKKTKAVWNYKHVENPFGESLVLVAEENKQIIGVRAFMRWNWQLGNKVFKAFRAVDTATHPDHQGKGIFKKLTMKALNIGEVTGEHFVFNTPNSQSKPGYLKMGWKKVGKISTKIIPGSPFRILSNSSEVIAYPESKILTSEIGDLLTNYHKDQKSKKKLFTPKSIDYLNWRYCENQIQSYFIHSSNDFFVAAYVKDRGKIKELRVSECIFKSKSGKKEVNNFVKELSKKYSTNIISYSSDQNISKLQVSGKFGPVLTLRNINCKDSDYMEFLNVKQWNYSIGDLELF